LLKTGTLERSSARARNLISMRCLCSRNMKNTRAVTTMLIDYLEGAGEELRRKKKEYQELNRQYREFYSKDIREEIANAKAAMHKKYQELNEELYENLHELSLIKAYFPELYRILLEDEDLGKALRKKDWLLEVKNENKEDAKKKLAALRQKRKQLQDAAKFMKEWPRERIDAKSIKATWPVLAGMIEGEMDKEDVLDAIGKRQKELRREGWKALINESMIEAPLQRMLKKIKELRTSEQSKHIAYEHAKGKGSVKEYEAQGALKEAQEKRKRMERMCRHLLLSGRTFLEKIKNRKKTGKRANELEMLADSIALKKINEKEWLGQMRKRIG